MKQLIADQNAKITALEQRIDTLHGATAVPTAPQGTVYQPLLISPNPVTEYQDEVSIQLPGTAGTYSLEIFDAVGNSLFEQDGYLEEGYAYWNLKNKSGVRITGSAVMMVVAEKHDGTVEYYRTMIGVQQ